MVTPPLSTADQTYAYNLSTGHIQIPQGVVSWRRVAVVVALRERQDGELKS